MGTAKKINKISVVDQVSNVLKEEILKGAWKEGDRLPSEGELSETYGVNRLSVRMALQKLNTLGLVETRVGEGSFVKNFSLKPILKEISPFYSGEVSYDEVKQFRYLLEGECLRIAVAEATEEEKEHLHLALLDYNRKQAAYYESDGDEVLLNETVDADFAFHYQTVRMSHNKLYRDLYHIVQTLVHGHIKQLLRRRVEQSKKTGERIPVNNEMHNRIYQAIVNSDPDEVDILCREMVGMDQTW